MTTAPAPTITFGDIGYDFTDWTLDDTGTLIMRVGEGGAVTLINPHDFYLTKEDGA